MDFSAPYSRSEYIAFFQNSLLPEDFEHYTETIEPEFRPEYIQSITKLGDVQSLDLTVYEVRHKSENDPRVSISKESFRLLSQLGQQRALILFYSDKSKNYRLSLVTIELNWTEGKRVKREYSNPRRLSFFLGEGSKIHTPQEYLEKPGRITTFDNLKDRFSIEVVNKDFYSQIALLFTKLAGGTRKIGREELNTKGALVYSGADEQIRKEFSVRLIGRLVFCWFLKKKTFQT